MMCLLTRPPDHYPAQVGLMNALAGANDLNDCSLLRSVAFSGYVRFHPLSLPAYCSYHQPSVTVYPADCFGYCPDFHGF
jgi:hypothetical protein